MEDLNEMVRSQDYMIYESEALGLQANIINGKTDPEIVTHQDIINCWRDYLDNLDVGELTYYAIFRDIELCEKRHEDAGTLEDIVYDYGGE